ncbi:MAG: DNA mismatch repair protein MutL [Methanoculleus sp. SDB]|nr:MAG: DNA mismatch repair protein MutL [Methanoculleus sp. SDB]
MQVSGGSTGIRVLDEETINKIAAGEVVERPASVVKELVENAIDAGASAVRVDIRTDATGVSRILVMDDGNGMEPDDARLAFLRHATSKITSGDDLQSIHTMGFRGEALASIAAVSRVTLVTKPNKSGSLAGIEIVVDGGEIISERETGAPGGTSIMVEDLFATTPARKKFLKRKPTELAHIYAVMEQCALAHPDVAFRLVQDGAEKIRTPGEGGLHNAVIALYGSEISRALVPVKGKTPYMRIDGFVATPSVNRPHAHQIAISVNERQISSPPLARAVRAGYGTLLPKNRYPVVFLAITIDTALVDVNVHPAKKEIRLSREDDVVRELAAAVRTALAREELIPEGHGPEQTSRPESSVFGGETAYAGVASPGGAYETVHTKPDAAVLPHRAITTTDIQLRLTEGRGGHQERSKLLPGMEIIGQVDDTYILAARKSGDHEDLVLIDQHAAHERVLYEQVLAKRGRDLTAQELLVPVVLSLRPKEAAAVRGARHMLMTEGFLIDDFGGDTFAVRTVPVVLGTQMPDGLIEDLIADLVAEHMKSAEGRKERITTVIACRGAIKAGTALSPDQMRRLLDQLARTENPWTCPHGRPTMVVFSRSVLDGMFHRT